MKRIGLMLAAALTLGVGGCKMNEADLSPDGKTLALATDQGLRLRPAEGGESRLVLPGEYGHPRYSPDGRYVALHSYGKKPKTVLFDTKQGKTIALPPLTPPYAWKSDGTELIGWQSEKQAAVVHIPSRQVVRNYDVPRPSHVVWLGSRDLGLQYPKHVALYRGGKLKKVSAELGMVYVLRGDAQRMSWMETNTPDQDFDLGKAKVQIRSMNLADESVSTVRPVQPASELVGDRRFLFPVVFSVSPDGDRIALSGLVDASPPGVMERAIEIQKRLSRRASKSGATGVAMNAREQQEFKELEKVMKFETVIASTDTLSGPFTIHRRHDAAMAKIKVARDLRWSADGNSIAVVYGDDTEVVPL